MKFFLITFTVFFIFTEAFADVVNSNGVSVNVSIINELYYVNGVLVGPTLKREVRSDGMYYFNDVPIVNYANPSLNTIPQFAKDGASEYLQAFTKFSNKNYAEALKFCDEALKISPAHKQAMVLHQIIQDVIDGKISDVDVKTYSLEKIAKMAKDAN